MRALLVGGGSCRGLELTRTLVADGHAVRIVTRTQERRPAIEAAGAECWIGTPDRIGTLRYALDNVTVALWLLGTATGPPEQIEPLHGSRLKMMLEKVTDTTLRGFVYEGAGPLPPALFTVGAGEVRWANEHNEIPFRLLAANPQGDRGTWLAEAVEAVDGLLAARRG